ncbi:MAG: hypothetical protein ACXVKH_17120, partial [Candidatus Angelobacter sp.]
MGQSKTSSIVLKDVLKIFFVFILTVLSGCGGGSVSAGGGGGNTGPSQAVIAFAVKPDTIIQGQSTTLTWQ